MSLVFFFFFINKLLAQQIRTHTVFPVEPRPPEPATLQRTKTGDEMQYCVFRDGVSHMTLCLWCVRIQFLSFRVTGGLHSHKGADNEPQTSAAQVSCPSCTQLCVTAGDFLRMRRRVSINLHSLPSNLVAIWQLSLSHHGVDYKGSTFTNVSLESLF